eukprot:40888-Eustigmatos_ZCMA.PRE.1
MLYYSKKPGIETKIYPVYVLHLRATSAYFLMRCRRLEGKRVNGGEEGCLSGCVWTCCSPSLTAVSNTAHKRGAPVWRAGPRSRAALTEAPQTPRGW